MLLQKFQNTSLTNFRIATEDYFQMSQLEANYYVVWLRPITLQLRNRRSKILDLGVLV
jgi:hypothetical protein